MRASVIIPNLNSPHLGEVLAGLQAQHRPPDEVIVVGQDIYHFAQEVDGVATILTDKPVQQATARNLGSRAASGDVLCFLDADCVPDNAWLDILLKRHNEGNTVVGGSIKLGNQSYWQTCDNIAHFGPRSQLASAGSVSYLLSGNLSMRASTFWRAGGFDESFRYLEDTALSLKLREQGHALVFEPQATVVHRNSQHNSMVAVWHHSYKYGLRWASVTQKFERIVGRSLRVAIAWHAPLLALVTAPIAAMQDTLGIYRQAALRQCVRYIPGVFWSRLGWCVGTARGRAHRESLSPSQA